ncbi:MAG TPA: hypothetical protein PKX58_09520 [Flexilinea sp.]|nr:hypothetical protein [Flexilinea sp.]HPJ66017.1 hypothetical protein [Flexilinea sp.]HPR72012.1 hypothetical protein [Flexilinea sp.]
MPWLIFFITTVVIVYSASRLSYYGDKIAELTSLGKMFVGMLLIAAATSLPEVITSLSSVYQGTPALAAGNLLGSNGFNMVLLAVVFLIEKGRKTNSSLALSQALMGTMSILLIALVIFFLGARIEWKIGWVGLDSLLIVIVYIISVRLLYRGKNAGQDKEAQETQVVQRGELGRVIVMFLIWAVLLIVATPFMVRSADEIAQITGLGNTVVGTTLVALVTSLPEMTTTIAAVRLGVSEMAVGNLFGSNMFNMFAIGLTDILYIKEPFIPLISDSFIFIGLSGLVMAVLGVINILLNLQRGRRSTIITSILMMLFYILGIVLVMSRG